MKISWGGWIVIVIFVSVLALIIRVYERESKLPKFRSGGSESAEIQFSVPPGKSHTQAVHRVWLEGPDYRKPEFFWFKIKFDDASKGAEIVYSCLDWGENVLIGDKFKIGENPFHVIPGTGTKNWNIYYIRIANEGGQNATGTITLVGTKRSVFDPTTGVERPLKFQ